MAKKSGGKKPTKVSDLRVKKGVKGGMKKIDKG